MRITGSRRSDCNFVRISFPRRTSTLYSYFLYVCVFFYVLCSVRMSRIYARPFLKVISLSISPNPCPSGLWRCSVKRAISTKMPTGRGCRAGRRKTRPMDPILHSNQNLFTDKARNKDLLRQRSPVKTTAHFQAPQQNSIFLL